MAHKTVFISYSWDSEEHQNWVLNLANTLVTNGVDVILDQYELSAGKEMTFFMEKSLTADKILIILTPKYKAKADKREGGVGYEYSLFTQEYYDKQPDQTKIIPILRTGDKDTSSPTFIKTRLYHDMRNDPTFDAKVFELIKIVIDKPLVPKPILGKIPEFDKPLTPDIEKRLNDFKAQEKLVNEKRALIGSKQGVDLFLNESNSVLRNIQSGIEHYKNNFGFYFTTKSNPYNLSYLLSTVNYTTFYRAVYAASNSAHGAHFILNFFRGPVGLEDLGVDYNGSVEVISKDKYFFDLDENKSPIWVNENDKTNILKTKDIPALIFREIINNEITEREKKL
jgi:hypothetical protein